MQNLITPSGFGIPSVNFNAVSGILIMKGRSIPEHPKAMFTPIINWIIDYLKQPAAKTELILKLDYINSSSYKFMLNIMELFTPIKESTTIKWYYELDDDDMKEVGAELKNIIPVTIEMIGVEEFE